MIALALNALVPIHLAFDLAEALAVPPFKHVHGHAHSHRHPGEHSLLVLLTGHSHAADHQRQPDRDHGKPPACAVCSAVTALAGFAPAAPAMLSPPVAFDMPLLPSAVAGWTSGVLLAYRSRAPPAV